MDREQYVIDSFSKCGISIGKEQSGKFTALFDFMSDYNKKVNLTAIKDFETAVTKHFIDSVIPFSFFEIPEGARFADIGTGAGFPAVPLLICRPDLRGVLCDSMGKRCDYLKILLARLNMNNAEVINIRGEELAVKNREKFDFVTARAVASLRILAEICLPMVKTGGYFAALKSESTDEEISEAEITIKRVGGEIDDIKNYSIPDGGKRRLIMIKKIRPSSTEYPRSYAKILKNPLK